MNVVDKNNKNRKEEKENRKEENVYKREVHGNELIQVMIGEVVYTSEEHLLSEQTTIEVYAFVFRN